MVSLLKIVLRIIPWLLVVALMSWMLIKEKLSFQRVEGGKEIYQQSILNRVEKMGKLELVRYSFQEVTEIKQMADYIDFRFFKYKPVPDAKAVLISQGSATGCIDLSQLTANDISEVADTVYVSLPPPELCYFKIDLEESRIYDLQVSYMSEEDRKLFIEELYRVAEQQVKEAAMQTGILEQTRDNAQLILVPLLENLVSKPVAIQFKMSEDIHKQDL